MSLKLIACMGAMIPYWASAEKSVVRKVPLESSGQQHPNVVVRKIASTVEANGNIRPQKAIVRSASNLNMKHEKKSNSNIHNASADVPPSIRQLAVETFGQATAEYVLLHAVTTEATLNGKLMKLYAFAGDDALERLPVEFSKNVYGVNSLAGLNDVSAPMVDIGANLGTFSMAAYTVNPKVRILALEPMPITYLFLRWNLLANGIPALTKDSYLNGGTGGVFALNAGATADGRTIDIMYDPRKSENAVTSASATHGQIPSSSNALTGQEHKAKIQSLSLAKFFADAGVSSLSFFKIDCEGCEHEVVSTVADLIQHAEHVGAEVHPCLSYKHHSCDYPPMEVTKTRSLLCDIGRCCTTLGAKHAETCNS